MDNLMSPFYSQLNCLPNHVASNVNGPACLVIQIFQHAIVAFLESSFVFVGTCCLDEDVSILVHLQATGLRLVAMKRDPDRKAPDQQ